MRRRRALASTHLGLLLMWAAASCVATKSPDAQRDGVQRVFAHVRGITWPACAATIEVALGRRQDGVTQISISQSQQTVAVAFVPGTRAFSPASFRSALREANVEIDRLDVDACGVIDERDGKRWLVAAANRFVLAGGEAPWVGTNCVTGRLNDQVDPHELEVRRWRPTTDP